MGPEVVLRSVISLLSYLHPLQLLSPSLLPAPIIDEVIRIWSQEKYISVTLNLHIQFGAHTHPLPPLRRQLYLTLGGQFA